MYPLGLLLGIVCVTPCIVVYLLFIRGIDRYEPEPWWVLLAMLGWGAFGATVTAGLGSTLGAGLIQWFVGAASGDAVVTASTSTFVAPVVEETTKGVGLLVLWAVSAHRLKELDGPLDGAICGGVIGLGFTLTEDVLYLAGAMAEGGIEAFGGLFVLRTLFSGLSHASFTAVVGLGVGLAVEARTQVARAVLPIAGWLAAVGLHALHNALVTFFFADGLGLLAKLVLFWCFDMLFFILLVALVLRDRLIVLRGLAGEVGTLLGQAELERTTSPWMLLPLWNYATLSSTASGYSPSRRKQRALIELAFLKQRRGRGEDGLDEIERGLRAEIEGANEAGVSLA